jgi:hypothetical protein
MKFLPKILILQRFLKHPIDSVYGRNPIHAHIVHDSFSVPLLFPSQIFSRTLHLQYLLTASSASKPCACRCCHGGSIAVLHLIEAACILHFWQKYQKNAWKIYLKLNTFESDDLLHFGGSIGHDTRRTLRIN